MKHLAAFLAPGSETRSVVSTRFTLTGTDALLPDK